MATAEKSVHEPRVDPPPPPKLENLFSIYQEKEQDIKIHFFDVSKGPNAYFGSLNAMKLRQLRLSPLKIFTIPVTPLVNPKSKFSSYFIIRLFDSTDMRYIVDLLFRDSDLYFVGFRRHVTLTDEEEALLRQEKEEEAGSSKKGEKKKEEKSKKKSGKQKAKEKVEKAVRERRKRGGALVSGTVLLIGTLSCLLFSTRQVVGSAQDTLQQKMSNLVVTHSMKFCASWEPSRTVMFQRTI